MNKRNVTISLAALIILGAVFRSCTEASWPITNAPPGGGPIIAFGDSLTAGVGASQGETYPNILSRTIGRPIINCGVPGETASEALPRVAKQVVGRDPSIVIVLLGGNDLLRNSKADETFGALDQIVAQCQEAGAMVVLVGIEGVPGISENFGKRFKELAQRRGCIYVPDVMDDMLLDRNLMTSDNIHPNNRGYALIAERIAEKLLPHL